MSLMNPNVISHLGKNAPLGRPGTTKSYKRPISTKKPPAVNYYPPKQAASATNIIKGS